LAKAPLRRKQYWRISPRISTKLRFQHPTDEVSLSIPSGALAINTNPNVGILTSLLFGQMRNATDMRQVQLGLRAIF
jgi:hypothetical protein